MWGEVTDAYILDQKLWFRASVVAERYWAQNDTITSYCSIGYGCGKNSWGTPTCGCTFNSPVRARIVDLIQLIRNFHCSANLHASLCRDGSSTDHNYKRGCFLT